MGLKRLFLHSASVEFTLRATGRRYMIEAPLSDELKDVLLNIRISSVQT
jgi:23S rRNA pseudouridine955/2504/2580 synthase